MSEGKINKKQARSEEKIFTIPFNPAEIKENFSVNTNTIYHSSKEEIINQAFKLHSRGNIVEASKYYKLFISKGFKDERVFLNYGVILKGLGKLKDAEILYRKAIEFNPDFADAHSNLGVILKGLGKLKEAELSCRKAIQIKPDFANAQYNLGNILIELKQFKNAEIFLRKAIELKPDFAEAYCDLGAILIENDNLKEAEINILKAIKLNPRDAKSYYNLGGIFNELGKLDKAELSQRKAIQIKPDYADAHHKLGNILKDLGNFGEALKQYKQALKFDNKLSLAKIALIATKSTICDWSDEGSQNIWLESLGIKGKPICPYELFPVEDNPLNHLKRSKNFYIENYIRPTKYLTSSKKNIIHIGYFSADFRTHPVMQLIARLLELHDKSRFKIYLYSFVPKEDEYTKRAKKSGCEFKNISKLNHIEAVELARNDELDIAVDLMGYTQHHRMPIFSYRVAPIQINYLGFPGTVGSETIDYIIADNITVPLENEEFYSEKIIRMPNCFQCNDNTKEISKESIFRRDFNLPDQGFIFTCFNNNNKITKIEFNLWMNLLLKTEGSVLWLYKSNQWSINNLYKEARKRKVDPDRLIFAERLPLKKHLARHSLGDLALDTFNSNGATTTSDALWAGLPVLTKIGQSFCARTSASLLSSIGLPELITYSESEYEEKALYIASNPEEAHRLKSKLKKLKETSPLYNSELFTQDLENIYLDLVEK
tara:strand:- start:425 stop:2569 length:2145 start_codon:yes stop_codon:yes gene_type:complete